MDVNAGAPPTRPLKGTRVSTTIRDALNAQVRHELTNAHAYLAVALYFGHLNLHGLEAYMNRQADEERRHAQRFINHLTARGCQPELGNLPDPQANFASPLQAARAIRDMELKTTQQIHDLFQLARKEHDFPLEILLHWFISEQVEEEEWSGELATLIEQFHDRPGQLFMLDHQWGKRTENPK